MTRSRQMRKKENKDNNLPKENRTSDELSKSCVNKGLVFGKCYEECELIQLPQYAVPIPAGLEGLKRRLFESGGLDLEGVFRLRGKEASIRASKNILDNGSNVSELQCKPIEMAQVLKLWFREVMCNDPGFVSLKLLQAQTEEEIKQEFTSLTEPRRTLLLWVFDLWIDVDARCNKNKMSLNTMSIVFSPNLVRSEDPNAMIFLQYQKEAQRVLEIASRLRKNGQLQLDTPGTLQPLFTSDGRNKPNVSVEYVRHISSNSTTSNNSTFSNLLKSCVVL